MDIISLASRYGNVADGLQGVLARCLFLAHSYRPLDADALLNMLRDVIPHQPRWFLYWAGLAVGTLLAVCFRRRFWVFPIWFLVVLVTGLRCLMAFVQVVGISTYPPDEPVIGWYVSGYVIDAAPSAFALLVALFSRPELPRPTGCMWICAVLTVIGYHAFVFGSPWILSRRVVLYVHDDNGRPISGATLYYSYGESRDKHGPVVSGASGRIRTRFFWATDWKGTITAQSFGRRDLTATLTHSALDWWVLHQWGEASLRGRTLSHGFARSERGSWVNPEIRVHLTPVNSLYFLTDPSLENFAGKLASAIRTGRLELPWTCRNLQTYLQVPAIAAIENPGRTSEFLRGAGYTGLLTYFRQVNSDMRNILEELSQDNVAPSERNRDLSILYELLADKSKEADTWQQKRNLVKQRLDSDNKLLERLPPDDKLSERSLLKRQN